MIFKFGIFRALNKKQPSIYKEGCKIDKGERCLVLFTRRGIAFGRIAFGIRNSTEGLIRLKLGEFDLVEN